LNTIILIISIIQLHYPTLSIISAIISSSLSSPDLQRDEQSSRQLLADQQQQLSGQQLQMNAMKKELQAQQESGRKHMMDR